MTEHELAKLKESLQTINKMITRSETDLSKLSFEGTSLNGDLLKKELENIGEFLKKEIDKVQEEQDKYYKMKNEFLNQAAIEIHCPSILSESEQHINIENQKNYFVVYSPNITYEYATHKQYGSYACLFDKDCNLLFHTNLGGKIKILGNSDFLLLNSLNDKYSKCNHFQLVDDDWKFRHNFFGIQSIKKCSDKFLEMKYESAPEFFNREGNEVYNELYNIETGKVVLQNFDGCKKEYPEFKNIEPNQFLLIMKKIKLSDSDNMARLQFFIDLDGKVVSNVFDLERGIVYPVDQNKEQLETLQDIYQLVLQSLEEEAKEIKNIYHLTLKRKNEQKSK